MLVNFSLKFQDTLTTNWFPLNVSNYFVLHFFCTSRAVCLKARRFTRRTGIIVVNFVVYKECRLRSLPWGYWEHRRTECISRSIKLARVPCTVLKSTRISAFKNACHPFHPYGGGDPRRQVWQKGAVAADSLRVIIYVGETINLEFKSYPPLE